MPTINAKINLIHQSLKQHVCICILFSLVFIRFESNSQKWNAGSVKMCICSFFFFGTFFLTYLLKSGDLKLKQAAAPSWKCAATTCQNCQAARNRGRVASSQSVGRGLGSGDVWVSACFRERDGRISDWRKRRGKERKAERMVYK